LFMDVFLEAMDGGECGTAVMRRNLPSLSGGSLLVDLRGWV